MSIPQGSTPLPDRERIARTLLGIAAAVVWVALFWEIGRQIAVGL